MTDEKAEFGKSENQEPDQKQEAPKSDELSSKLDKLLEQERNSQEFIRTLKTENETYRDQLKEYQAKLDEASKIDDLLAYQQKQQTTNQEPDPKSPQIDTSGLLNELEQRVLGKLTEQEKLAAQEKNWQDSLNEAKAKFGERYDYYVDERSKELGLSTEHMENLARTSPKAFMNLLGGGNSGTRPTESSLSTNQLQDTNDVSKFEEIIRKAELAGPEGREAKKLKRDPNFQREYRKAILAKAQKEGRL